MPIKPIILCGGSGTRLWPQSRKKFPKQFVKLFKDNSLIDLTLKRLSKIKRKSPPLIITNDEYRFYVQDALKKTKMEGSCVLEPFAKNTTAAIYLAAKLSSENEDLLILPSDHFVKDEENFINALIKASKRENKNNWVIFGEKPKYPATGFGYIQLDHKSNDSSFYKVLKFEEKPDLKKAHFFINNNFLWNCGIFMGNKKIIIHSIKKYAPQVAVACDEVLKSKLKKTNSNDVTFDRRIFKKIPSISIDYSVMEKEKKIICYPLDCGWNDIGSWDGLSKVVKKNSDKKVFQLNSKNNFIKSDERLIATIGIEDLIIIDTKDTTLISKKGESENVKLIVNQISKKNFKEALENKFELRPWGKFENLLETSDCKVKKITVLPKKRLSKQYHNFRSEHWLVVKGIATIYINDEKFILEKGNSIDIKTKDTHYVENASNTDLIIIETQMGTYFGEDDIVRLDDPYERE